MERLVSRSGCAREKSHDQPIYRLRTVRLALPLASFEQLPAGGMTVDDQLFIAALPVNSTCVWVIAQADRSLTCVL